MHIMYGYTHNSISRPGETAVIFDTSGEINCPVNYSKNRCTYGYSIN